MPQNIQTFNRMCRIKMFPALNGDSFLLTIDDVTILVDGGYVDTYQNFLKAELATLSKPLALLIVTHIDGDHISGINKLLDRNADGGNVPIGQIWHNAYRHIQPYALQHPVLDTFVGKDLDDFTPSSYLSETIADEGAVSARQGSALAAMIARDGHLWNVPFDSKAVSIENGDTVDLTTTVKIRLLSPNRDKLQDLHKYWRKELYKLGYVSKGKTEFFDDAFEFVLAKEKPKKLAIDVVISGSVADMRALAATDFIEDSSPTNGSSIAFVLEFAEKKILMLGDAHPGLVADQLKKHYPGVEGPIWFDLVKLSHHGSESNTSPRLLELIDSEKFLFSTNGDHYDHPDLITIARIVTRPAKQTRKLYFNYPVPLTGVLNNETWQKEFNYTLIIGAENRPLEIDF